MNVLVRVATAISGVVGVVLPNVGAFNLPVATQATITAVGGGLLALLAILEHPTTKAAAGTTTTPTTTTKVGS